MKRISAVVITYNEEEKIQRALTSLKPVSDEIIVVDSYSTDATVEYCRRYTDRVLLRVWEGYRDQKQFATDQARHDWILSLDGDEVLSTQLREELLQWKQEKTNCEGYYFPRKAFFMGRWIEHTTWYPDWQLRLFEKSCGRWAGGRVHESVRVTGPTGKFKGHIYHHTYASFSEYLAQLERFSALAARDHFDNGKRAHWSHLVFYPPAIFLKNYLLCLGFLDGMPGLAVSFLAVVSTLFKYLKLWEIQSGLRNEIPINLQND
ncbi:glycosyltransferase family 2 protein [Acidobacteria bacterium AH-259-D05]|nr:glycosyltransferase family 2 protein [Acidobacteria bacterium AH-259-D05]